METFFRIFRSTLQSLSHYYIRKFQILVLQTEWLMVKWKFMKSGLSYIECDFISNLQLPYLCIIDPLNHMEVLFHLNSSLSVIANSMTHHGKFSQHHTLRIYCVKNTMRFAGSTRIHKSQCLSLRSSQIAWNDSLIKIWNIIHYGLVLWPK